MTDKNHSTVPTLPAKYKPIDESKLGQKHDESQERNKFYFNRRNAVRPLPELIPYSALKNLHVRKIISLFITKSTA